MAETADIPIGVGFYTISEAARYTGIDPSTIRRWIHGYRFSKRDGSEGESAAVFRRELPRVQGRIALSFLDLVELLFVRAFRHEGVSLPVIRKAAKEAARRWRTDHAFCRRRFATDGRTIFASIEDPTEEEAILELTKSQLHFAKIVNPYLKQMDFTEAGDISRWWPLGKEKGVYLDPTVSFGKPVTVGRSVPTDVIYRALRVNESAQDVADWYGIAVSAVRAAAQFEESRAA